MHYPFVQNLKNKITQHCFIPCQLSKFIHMLKHEVEIQFSRDSYLYKIKSYDIFSILFYKAMFKIDSIYISSKQLSDD